MVLTCDLGDKQEMKKLWLNSGVSVCRTDKGSMADWRPWRCCGELGLAETSELMLEYHPTFII